MSDALTYYMWLTIGFSPCNPRKWDMLLKYDSINSFYKNMKSDLYLMTASEQASLMSASLFQAESLIEYCNNKNINIYCYEDIDYPDKLREIENPPSVIFVLGNLQETMINHSVAIVGSRDAEDYAIRCTKIISSGLAQRGVTIISGFARGIDTAAHESAIAAGGKTIAILGCGLEYDYPKYSSNLKNEIAKNGAVISEYFPATKPNPENFKIRNRLSAALSDAVLCTQASAKSGAINTVYHALQQGKDVYVTPPHDIMSTKYDGIISLLRDGAEQIYSANDILYRFQQKIYL